eukprot:5932051-Pleurochrysis_carterae.AAC.1
MERYVASQGCDGFGARLKKRGDDASKLFGGLGARQAEHGSRHRAGGDIASGARLKKRGDDASK